MDLKALAKQGELFLRSNSPAILTGMGVTGVVSTGYLAHQAGWNSAVVMIREDDDRLKHGVPFLTRKEQLKLRWKGYIPLFIAGGATITCIIVGAKISNRRTAALAAAYSISERAFVEYKDKVKEKLGERKEQTIRDDIAADKVKANPPSGMLYVGEGNVLCYELHTGRPFVCTMDKLKKAENEINARLLREDFAYIHNFYDLVGLPHTDSDYDFGWTSGKLLELEFTSVIWEDKPVLAFAYNYYKPL